MQYLIVKKLPLQQGAGQWGNWKSQEVILEADERAENPSQFLVRFTGKRVDELKDLEEGELVDCEWRSTVRSFKRTNGDDGYANELRGWFIAPAGTVQSKPF